MSLSEIFGSAVHAVTRAEALESGALVAADSQLAREAGWRWPVALTAAAWTDCVAWDAEAEARHGGYGQSETGRLWDVLFLAFLAARRTNPGHRSVRFEVLRIRATGVTGRASTARLAVFCGPGDSGEPVITIMQADED
ncbi:DUF6573 family protein [Streptomyces sp. NRRL B-24484]|uniref:DUF6573 family protein n=1 Tax=Streptomyces sp. NRRL B-24484 TaxID=1463833 RepID=UPI0004BE5AA6|nr:DUF6573 family protein [Streptomyces sp. NRRL B-24484]